MSQEHDDPLEEEQTARWLAAADRDLPPPDREFLTRLREQSTAEFLDRSPEGVTQATRQYLYQSRWKMRAFVLAVAASLLAFFVWWPQSPLNEHLAFSHALEATAQAPNLHVKLVAEQEDIWVAQPDRMRWDKHDGTYTLTTGDTEWDVNESINTAKARPSRHFENGRIELVPLHLIGMLRDESWDVLLRQRPVERVVREGRKFDVYRYYGRNTSLGAEVDVSTRRLQSFSIGPGTAVPIKGDRGLGVCLAFAYQDPIPAEKFTVKETLTEDGRIGKVTDVQGIVAIQPVLQGRWTPVCNQLLLKPGDWLRTDVRGANAVALRLMKETDVILGPGSLAEFKSPTEIRLHYGEIEVAAPEKPAVQLVAANQEPITLKGRTLYRLGKDEKLVRVEKDPPWLAGFKGARPQESIGSLVANIDGRNTPLTVGYHKVTVDIRDQIARTVVEESFVNHTTGTLEGVFHFPLPQDASISGFGMWIGNELVEADVVEKQRAREIYETILRERRDPGLLEWSGGNLFKARVFPIFPRSEKRIKITYTQVLPLKGNSYRYSYALQSELLKQHPLRELSIDVKLASVLPVKQVSCPTHPARVDRTDHAGHVEFSAQEHTPTRDFEVLIETASQQEVAVIPHRRGEDGYFMLLLQPPAAGGAWQRDLLPKGDPLKLLLVADTSASLDEQQRKQQAELVAAICSALTAEDTINLACCDVTCDWAFETPQPANAANIDKLREHLAARRSLGWTDLDKAFSSALSQADDKTNIIYLGDGVSTTGNADPQAFIKRLEKLHAKKAALHAVALGSTFEPAVMRGIAALGGGSVRRIEGEQTPQRVALDLLAELADPGLRDIKLEFQGLRVARVYPERLPNLPSGSQQIVLGRYLPSGRDQQGEVVVTAKQGNKDLRFRTTIALKDAEEGNSFIPRLWARMHLDALLDQGSSEAIKEEVIALSEEYHIITPYTSLLVLESDEDRQRFKVQRRFQMRDGEKFFQEGRDQARFALMQQQMQRAAAWRLELRRSVLAELARAGRDPRWFQPQQRYDYGYFGRLAGGMGGAGGFGGGSGRFNINGPMGGPGGSVDRLSRLSLYDSDEFGSEPAFLGDRLDALSDYSGRGSNEGWDIDAKALDKRKQVDSLDLAEAASSAFYDRREAANESLAVAMDFEDFAPARRLRQSFAGLGEMPVSGPMAAGKPYGGRMKSQLGYYSQDYTHWFDELYPQVPATPSKPKAPAEEFWPQGARELADSLLRNTKLAALSGGLELKRTSQTFDVRKNNQLASQQSQLELVSPQSWLVRSGGGTSQTIVQWCDAQTRGAYSEAFQLGRQRASKPGDLEWPPLGLSDYSLSPIYVSYNAYKAEVRTDGKGQQRLVLTPPNNTQYQVHYVIDTERHVLLAVESHVKGEITSTTKLSDFVEIGGQWWATKIESFDKAGRRHTLTTESIVALNADDFANRLKQELAGRAQVELVPQPLPSVAQAKSALADGKANFAEQLALVLHFARSQQWSRVDEHLAECEKLAADKPGVRWMRRSIYSVSRRHEELRKLLLAEAEKLSPPPMDPRLVANEYALAAHSLRLGQSVLESREVLTLLKSLRPVYDRQPAYTQVVKEWRRQEAYTTENAGQSEAALKLYEQFARDYPEDAQAQREYIQRLANYGEHAAAYAWLDRVLKQREWELHEESSLRESYANLLQNQGRYPDLAKYLSEWIEQSPQSSTPYQQYLTALIRSDQLEKANETMRKWLREAMQPGELPAATAQKLYAVVQHALGQGYNFYTHRVEPEWEEPLAEAVLFFARHEFQAATAEQIMNTGSFQQTDACRRLRRTVLKWLLDEVEFAKLKPAEVARFVSWVLPDDPAVTPEQWKDLATRIEKRWQAEEDVEAKHTLGQALVSVLSQRIGIEQHLAFLRRELADGPKKYQSTYANHLFDTLLAQPWTDAFEQESIALLPRLFDGDDAQRRLLIQVAALHRWTDRMVQARNEAGVKAIEKPESLTRTQLREKQQEILKQARQGVADRLQALATMQQPPLAEWLTVERLYLDLLTGRELAAVEDGCWEHLGAAPKAIVITEENAGAAALEELLNDRYLAMLANLAVRSSAKPELIDRLLAYLAKGESLEGEDPDYWRLWQYRLLIGLDRPQQLAGELQQWMRGEDPLQRWRQALGYLLAEQGSLEQAVKLFEGVELTDELGPAAYRTLADWYQALGQREDYERAMIRSFATIEEWQLSNYLRGKMEPWRGYNNRPLPSELDQEVLLVFRALFAKAGSPQSYVYQLQEFYRASRDFRLLAVLADSVLGHSAGKAYPFLQSLGTILNEIRDEATADSLVERIDQVRKRAMTPVDRRALDLLETLVERRAAELKNQPGPHADRALAALKRAFEHEWTSGEPRLMAELLSGMGRISHAGLAAEQVRQLEALDRREGESEIDRLLIAHALANAYWNYERHGAAIDRLEAALQRHIQASDGLLISTANAPFSTLIRFHEGRDQFVRGERLISDQLKRPANRQQEHWLIIRQFELYRESINAGGETSLGTGAAQFIAVTRKMQAALETPDVEHRYQLIERACQIYVVAHQKKLAGVQEDLEAFAFQRLPPLLTGQATHLAAISYRVAHTLHDVVSARSGLRYLIDRLEKEPAWLRYNNEDTWNRNASVIGQWRTELKDLGELEPRLLAVVIKELKRDLATRTTRNRYLYHDDYPYFWREKADDFARAADEVLAEHKESIETIKYIATYVDGGLERTARAAEILGDAHTRGILDESGTFQLVGYLHRLDRYGESIPLLEPLVALKPENMNYRVYLMRAYFKTSRGEQLVKLLDETDAFFHQKNRWSENVLAALAASTLENKLYERSVAYYKELIPLHERTQPGRGIGRGTLSSYYSGLAEAHAGLKQTAEAVEAACGAIVSWGPRHEQRDSALHTVVSVLKQSPDLEAYVATLDARGRETGLQNPLVRKALGQVYLESQKPVLAIAQLKLALETQPNDSQTYDLLLSAYDRAGDAQGAIAAIFEAVQLRKRELKLYQSLGERLAKLDQAQQAERAYTSIVEMQPNESESHTLLAEIRQGQNRWPDAIEHWQRVAEIRALEPTGLLKLAEAQLHERRWDDAQATVDKLRSRGWPDRFGDIAYQARAFEQRIQQGRNK